MWIRRSPWYCPIALIAFALLLVVWGACGRSPVNDAEQRAYFVPEGVPETEPTAMSAEEAETSGGDLMRRVLVELKRQDYVLRLTANIETWSDGELYGKWAVDYSGTNKMPSDPWRAQGHVSYDDGELVWVFDSSITTSCIRELKPEPTPWDFAVHLGWRNRNNPDTFTPPIPLLFTLLKEQPRWRVVGDSSDGVVVSHDPTEESGLVYVLHVNSKTLEVNRVIGYINGNLARSSTYKITGTAPLRGVHTGRLGCLRRNSR